MISKTRILKVLMLIVLIVTIEVQALSMPFESKRQGIVKWWNSTRSLLDSLRASQENIFHEL